MKCDFCDRKMIESKCPLSNTPAWYCKKCKFYHLKKVTSIKVKT